MDYLSKFLGFAAIASVLTVYCSPVSANVQTWGFDKSTQTINKTKGTGRSLDLASSDGVRLKITGFSDTKEKGGADKIQRAKLSWASDDALGMKNKAEKSKFEITGESKDSKKVNRGIDSVVTRTGRREGQYDMVLLEFDTAVSLDGLTLDWARGGDAAKKTADISILAYTGDGSSELRKNTWAQVLGSGDGDAFDAVGNYSNVGLSYYAVNTAKVTSTKWLIGVYNPIFGKGGDAGDDAFRLGAIQTSMATKPGVQDEPTDEPTDEVTGEPKEVPEPGTLVLLLMGLLVLFLRRYVKAPR